LGFPKFIRGIGFLLIISGFILNPWFIGLFPVVGEQLNNFYRIIILIFDALMIFWGMVFVFFNQELADIAYKELAIFGILAVTVLAIMEFGAANYLNDISDDPVFSNKVPHNEKKLSYYSNSSFLPWSIKRNHNQYFTGCDFRIKVKTNNMGFRENIDFDFKKPSITIVGDEIALGLGVEQNERFSDYLKREYGSEKVLNLAPSCGFAPIHYYIYLKKNPDFIPKTLLLVLNPLNDLDADVKITEVFPDQAGDPNIAKTDIFINQEGIIESKSERSFLYRILNKFNFGRFILKSKTDIEKMDAEESLRFPPAIYSGKLDGVNYRGLEYILYLSEMMSRERGNIIVLLMPDQLLVSKKIPNPFLDKDQWVAVRKNRSLMSALGSWMHENNIQYIDPSEGLLSAERAGSPQYLEKSGQLSKSGHETIGRLLLDVLR